MDITCLNCFNRRSTLDVGRGVMDKQYLLTRALGLFMIWAIGAFFHKLGKEWGELARDKEYAKDRKSDLTPWQRRHLVFDEAFGLIVVLVIIIIILLVTSNKIETGNDRSLELQLASALAIVVVMLFGFKDGYQNRLPSL